MKALLMHRDRDFDAEAPLPQNAEALVQDLQLSAVFDAMARGDEFLRTVAHQALLSSLSDPAEIAYRQALLSDCLKQPEVIRELYAAATDAVEREKSVYWGFLRASPDSILRRSLKVLGLFVEVLRRLRRTADAHAEGFHSEGFRRFFAMLQTELDDSYFDTIAEHLDVLAFRGGMLMSAGLGEGNKGAGYILRRYEEKGLLERVFTKNPQSYSFQVPDRDDNGFKALEELRGRGTNLVADALARSTHHIRSFLAMLRTELGFYVGCLNLHDLLQSKGEPCSFPRAEPAGSRRLAGRKIYDASLSLHIEERSVGNDLESDGAALLLITGANRGGKSTFLRSLGIAQLMMQCGMFVAAEQFRAEVCQGVFTHFKREEDAGMKSGKLDEELARMSTIADRIRPNSILLCNESFASTNEREGSEIARQILRALRETHVKVCFVTHMFDLSDSLYREGTDHTVFLRAERLSDGARTFRLLPGKPLATSYGKDAFERVFDHQASHAGRAGEGGGEDPDRGEMS